jgi:hypothetical protein
LNNAPTRQGTWRVAASRETRDRFASELSGGTLTANERIHFCSSQSLCSVMLYLP